MTEPTQPTDGDIKVDNLAIGDSGATSTEYGAEALVEAVRRAEQANAIEPYYITGDPDSLIVRVMDADQRIDTLDLERKLDQPRRARGTATLHDAHDFATYVNRLKGAATTIFAREDDGEITAIFNDHTDHDTAGWRDHTATLRLKDDPEWQAWLAANNKLFTQGAFAEFLQDRASSIIAPDAATILEIALTFKAHKKADFDGEVDLDHGTVQFSYKEEVRQKVTSGQMELPTEITISLAPFLGMEPVQMIARLKWNVDSNGLALGYRIHRPDLMRRQAFEQLRDEIAGATLLEVRLGIAPAAVNPQI